MKRLKFFLSFILIFAIFVSSLSLTAMSYETDVETSTADMLLVNLDTDTVVFSQKPDNIWYAGSLSELMTFLVAYESIEEPKKVTFKVEQSFLDGLPYKDGCLDKFVGQTLTATDLMAIMLLTSGSDAAYALASLAFGGDIDAFVKSMNERAVLLGCDNTGYVSPGMHETSAQYTTCRDLHKLYMAVRKISLFSEIMKLDSYTPKGLDAKQYSVGIEVSILNPDSPYYFKYTNDAQFSYTEKTYANIAVTTTYHGQTYFYAGLLGLNDSERNAYADAKKLTTWAYLNLSDRKLLADNQKVSDVKVQSGWGEYKIELHPYNSAYRTLPKNFDDDKLTYDLDVPATVKTPFVKGQALGRTKVLYDDEQIDDIALISDSDEGLDMLSDMGRFGGYVIKELMPFGREEEEDSQKASDLVKPADAENAAGRE